MFDPSGKNPNDWLDPSQINLGRDFMGIVKRRFTRMQGHPRYYLADLSLSRHSTRWNPPDRSSPSGDIFIPDGRLDRLNDPFGLDIYCLGSLVRENFVRVRVT